MTNTNTNTETIHIRTDDTGQITNQFYGDASILEISEWESVQQSDFPDVTLSDSEYAVYQYDASTGEITATVEVNTTTETENI